MIYRSESRGEVELSAMHESHLRNAIAKLRRREQTNAPLPVSDLEILRAMEAELMARDQQPTEEP